MRAEPWLGGAEWPGSGPGSAQLSLEAWDPQSSRSPTVERGQGPPGCPGHCLAGAQTPPSLPGCPLRDPRWTERPPPEGSDPQEIPWEFALLGRPLC